MTRLKFIWEIVTSLARLTMTGLIWEIATSLARLTMTGISNNTNNKMNYYVYIITNNYNTVLYVGVTNNLVRRIYEHKNKLIDGFSKKYNLNKLVYFEETTDVNSAILREKQLKSYKRCKKIALIEKINPTWEEIIIF